MPWIIGLVSPEERERIIAAGNDCIHGIPAIQDFINSWQDGTLDESETDTWIAVDMADSEVIDYCFLEDV